MSIASEITRLQNAKATLKTKLNAKNDAQHQITNQTIDNYGGFVDSIPTGTEIDGQLVNKTATSNINKGDFVQYDETIKNYSVNSNFTVDLRNNTLNDVNNFYDNDDNTYATMISGDTYNGIQFRFPSNDVVGIPNNAVITRVDLETKVYFTGTGSSNYRFINISNGNKGMNAVSLSTADIAGGQIVTKTLTSTASGALGTNAGVNNFFITYLTQINKQIRLYYAKFNIYYIDEGKVKVATYNLSNPIAGIANSNANNGDTVQVYIPNNS